MTLTFSRKPRKSLIRRIIELIIKILLALIVALFIIANIVSFTQIKEESMEPTLADSDRVVVYKLGYILDQPKNGDIIILNRDIEEKGIIKNMINEGNDIVQNIKYRFNGQIEKNNLVKRIVGTQGDRINIVNGKLFINQELEEGDYIKGSTPANDNIRFPLEVAEGKVFVLGDNREHSLDSRDFGLIDIENVKGKVVYRIFPLSEFGKLK